MIIFVMVLLFGVILLGLGTAYVSRLKQDDDSFPNPLVTEHLWKRLLYGARFIEMQLMPIRIGGVILVTKVRCKREHAVAVTRRKSFGTCCSFSYSRVLRLLVVGRHLAAFLPSIAVLPDGSTTFRAAAVSPSENRRGRPKPNISDRPLQ
jgi:hypothetical protein